MKSLKYKVLAYITHENRLLLFNHPYEPEAGIQVPAGTIEPGEQPEQAVLREAFEETGLTGLILDSFLGEQVRDMADFEREEVHHRSFYHLRYSGQAEKTWRHAELYPSDNDHGPHIFEFFWAPLPNGVPELIADHGLMLPQLIKRLELV